LSIGKEGINTAERTGLLLTGMEFRGGLVIDSFGRTEAVKLIHQAFADHREILRKREVSDAIIALLDLFIWAGWSEAIRISFRVGEGVSIATDRRD
jgi:hypothetical protein